MCCLYIVSLYIGYLGIFAQANINKAKQADPLFILMKGSNKCAADDCVS